LADYKITRRHFAFTPTPLEKTKPALPGAKRIATDHRTYVNDVSIFGNGAKIQNTQSGILVEITKKATTANVVCHMFVLSDGVIGIENGQLTGVQC
jgi:hypothetical protein